MDEENLVLQTQEIEILKSIYQTEFSCVYSKSKNNHQHNHCNSEDEECDSSNTTDESDDSSSNDRYQIKISIDLPTNYKINVLEDNGNLLSYSIVCLPKLNLTFQYSNNYPTSPPTLFISSCWLKLKQMKLILDHLNNEMWEKDELVIFKYVDWIKSNLISFLGIQDGLLLDKESMFEFDSSEDDDSGSDDEASITQSKYNNVSWDYENGWVSTVSALPLLRSYNSHQGKILFSKQWYQCSICEEESQCTLLSNCSHYACNDCMSSIVNINLESGDFDAIKCPEWSCKQSMELSIIELFCKQPKEALLDYQDFLKRSKGLVKCTKCLDGWAYADQISKTTYCSTCYYSFCLLCREQFHPGLECFEKPQPKSEKKRLKSRVIKQIVIETPVFKPVDLIRVCPSCGALISKIEGCNKVLCMGCKCYFCWICCKPNITYAHFGVECELFLAVAQKHVFVPRPKFETIAHTTGRGPNRVGLLTGEDNFEEVNKIDASTLCKCKNVVYRFGRSNTLYCGHCKFNFCFICKIQIKGTRHFMTSSCCQNGEPDSTIWKPDSTYRFFDKNNPPPTPQKIEENIKKQVNPKQDDGEGLFFVKDIRTGKTIRLD